MTAHGCDFSMLQLIKKRDAPREANLVLLNKLAEIEAEQEMDIKRINVRPPYFSMCFGCR